MLKNYIKTTLRVISRHKVFSFLNFIGLAIGMACSILIFLWVNSQLSYDRSQENRNNIYRLEAEDWVTMPTAFCNAITDIPEIKKLVKFNSWIIPTIKYNKYLSNVEDFIFVDNSVFEVFTFDFIAGNPGTALEAPFSLVITESLAKIIFGDKNPVGEVVRYNNTFDFTVTGVIKDVDRLHINIKALAPFNDLPVITGRKNFLNEYNWNY